MRRPGLRLLQLVGLLAALAIAVVPVQGSDAAALPGSAGVDTSLAETESAMTLDGRGPFADLSITLNQTANLGNQAISITWEGGTPTERQNNVTFGEHFLQIMQCWGDDDGTVPGNPGPPPEQCVFGASDAVYGGRNSNLFGNGGFADDRVVARGDFEDFDPEAGALDPVSNWQWKPFRGVNGDVIDKHIDTEFAPAVEGGQFWLNPFFNAITTNEIAGARTIADGSGQELFEVATGLQSSGLGCGQKVLGSGAEQEIPQCWIVVVPRGDAAEENADTIDGQTFEENEAVMTSPLAGRAWQNRIAFPLEFNPVDTPCQLTDDQRRIVGSELLVRAVSSWQPSLCAIPGLSPFSYAVVGDESARLQISTNAPGGPGMAAVSRPLDPARIAADDPIVYAPLTLSSVVIAFNIERKPDVQTLTPESEALSGVRIAELNLTPRLVAKLLTQSYGGQTRIANVVNDYEWVADNPSNLDADPDFLRFNPEFELLQENSQKHLGGLLLTAGTSDAAIQVWEWILADPEAKRWLAGAPDEWGMQVNPVYSTSADLNPTGVPFGDPVPNSYPKSDPYCYQAPDGGATGRVVAPLLCGTDWLPYALGLRDAAQRARAGNDGAKVAVDPFAETTERFYRSDGPQLLGSRAMLAMVDSPSARQYGLQLARLSQAGDNGDDRGFVAPDEDGMVAAVDAMKPGDEPQVLEPVATSGASDGYPLTTLTYAAVRPVDLDQPSREEYAAFIEYAVGDGQVPGEEIGRLPPGYAVLPDKLREQSAEAAAAIVDPEPTGTEPEPTTSTTAPPEAPAASGGGSEAGPPRVTPGGTVSEPTPEDPPATAPSDTPVPGPADENADEELALETEPSGAMTPASAVGIHRWVVPALLGLVVLAGWMSLEVTDRARRRARKAHADRPAPSAGASA